MRRLAPPVAARGDAKPNRVLKEVHRYCGKRPSVPKVWPDQQKLILVQCAICGMRKVLREECAEEFMATNALPCIFTHGCWGYLYARHEGCRPPMLCYASTVRNP